MKKVLKGIHVMFIAIGMITYISGCQPNNPIPSHCLNGVQDNGETGVDCGGTCPTCSVTNQLCNGNGSNSYWPLALGNVWHYDFNNDFDSVVSHAGSIYVVLETAYQDTLRIAGNGDIYSKPQNVGLTYTEFLFLPANPTVGQTWLADRGNGGKDTMTVTDLNTTVTTPSCSYSGCLKIKRGNLLYYFKKGVGWVQTHAFGSDVSLNSVKLN